MGIKVVLIGDTQVGKTCVLTRLTSGSFKPYPPTIGAAFQNYIMTTDKGSVELQIWDTAGQEKFRTLAPMYYRAAQCAILFFDLTQASSFQNLEQWSSELEDKTDGNMRVFLVGNKVDLADQRVISSEDAKSFSFEHGMVEYFETSAKTGEGVRELFTRVAECASTFKATPATEQEKHVDIKQTSTTSGDNSDCKC
ncbi:small GTP-binding protein [Histomonas meleagridis]|uniref:small GTP-binding protein n=1 Tax=Histomonas meleagridis TaxID=135588 RepID=UPI00355AC860|nr:small GTP-binding protein [Histomonas meleagridis]KAH0802886.1 small GTP-binding protein [Histomonas meleagridis]